jgi:hypothetical protein
MYISPSPTGHRTRDFKIHFNFIHSNNLALLLCTILGEAISFPVHQASFTTLHTRANFSLLKNMLLYRNLGIFVCVLGSDFMEGVRLTAAKFVAAEIVHAVFVFAVGRGE